MAAKKQPTESIDHKARLRAVLAAMGIKRGTFVDDVFSPTFDDAWARSVALAVGKKTQVASAWGAGQWEPDSREDDRPEATRAWESLDGKRREVLMRTLSELGGIPIPPPESDLSKYWPSEVCPLECLGPERFDGTYIKDRLLGEGPSILFVDLSFGEDDQEGGLRLLRDVLKEDSTGKTVCVVFTGREGADGVNYWADLSTAKGIAPEAAVVIHKDSAHAVEKLEADLRRALLNSLSPEFVKWASVLAKNALTAALSKTKIEGDVLNAAVLQSSEKEGIHPAETLFRLIDEQFKEERAQSVLQSGARAAFADIKKKLEALAQIAPKDNVDPPLSKRVQKLMRTHLYQSKAGPPEWPAAIFLGDLWEITLRPQGEALPEVVEHFVLVAQQCDIVLRSEGSRSQEWVILLPLKKDKGKHMELVVEFKYFDEKVFESRWVYLKKARVASANVLDLVALNGATVKKNEIAGLRTRPHVHASIEKRMGALADWLDGVLAKPETIELNLALFSGPGRVAKLTNTIDDIDFHCKRVGRIEPELAGMLLQRWGNFVSRYALPHDFADYE